MKAHFKKEPYFENESSFQNPLWKWKHVFRKLSSKLFWFYYFKSPQIFRPSTISARYSTVLYVGPLGKEVDWLIHLWHAISLSASPLYYGRVWVRLLQPHCTYLHYYIMEPNPLWNSLFFFEYFPPCWSVLDFWTINLEKSSSMKWIFSLIQTGFLLPKSPVCQTSFLQLDLSKIKQINRLVCPRVWPKR